MLKTLGKKINELRQYFIKDKRKKFVCYEIWRPNIPDDGCTEQCTECAEKELKLKNQN
jgi:hypothetical protein